MSRLHLLAPLLLATVCPAVEVPVWTTGTGSTSIVFQRDLLAAAGLEVRTGSGVVSAVAFALTEEAAIKFVSPWGSPDCFLGGSLRCDGGLELVYGTGEDRKTISVAPVELFALKDTERFELRDEDGGPVFAIDRFDVRFEPGLHQLQLMRGNLRLTREVAVLAGRPECEGLVVGVVDCAVDVHELAARIDRTPRRQPAWCSTPAGTNAQLAVRDIEAVQQCGAGPDGTVALAVALALRNDGPDALALSDAASLPVSLRFLAADVAATQVIAAVEHTIRVDAAAGCPCVDTARLYPGETARWSLADAIRTGLAAWIPAAALGDVSRQLVIEATLNGATCRRGFHARRSGEVWLFTLDEQPSAAADAAAGP